MNLSEIKEWLRVDDDNSDGLILGLQIAAEQYIGNAGVNKNYSNELYKIAINMLITHWFENREPTGKADKLSYGLSDIIIQLKYCEGGAP